MGDQLAPYLCFCGRSCICGERGCDEGDGAGSRVNLPTLFGPGKVTDGGIEDVAEYGVTVGDFEGVVVC